MRSRGARGPRARARKTPLAARPSQNPRAALPDRARALESPPLSKANLPGRFFVLRIEDLVLAEDAAARARTLRALEAFLGVPTATNRTIARLGAEFDGYAASYNARNGFRLFSPGEQARHTSAARRARALRDSPNPKRDLSPSLALWTRRRASSTRGAARSNGSGAHRAAKGASLLAARALGKMRAPKSERTRARSRGKVRRVPIARPTRERDAAERRRRARPQAAQAAAVEVALLPVSRSPSHPKKGRGLMPARRAAANTRSTPTAHRIARCARAAPRAP